MSGEEASKVIGKMADKFDLNKDGKFNYAGRVIQNMAFTIPYRRLYLCLLKMLLLKLELLTQLIIHLSFKTFQKYNLLWYILHWTLYIWDLFSQSLETSTKKFLFIMSTCRWSSLEKNIWCPCLHEKRYINNQRPHFCSLKYTVKPVLSGHPNATGKWPLKRNDLSKEVSLYIEWP